MTAFQLLTLSEDNPIIIFDDECMLCSKSVHWVVKNDNKRLFRFMTQNDWKEKFNSHFIEAKDQDSIVLLKNGILYFESEAIAQILHSLGGFQLLIAKCFSIFPKLFRNGVYKLIAKNRKRIFGKTTNCNLENKELVLTFV